MSAIEKLIERSKESYPVTVEAAEKELGEMREVVRYLVEGWVWQSELGNVMRKHPIIKPIMEEADVPRGQTSN